MRIDNVSVDVALVCRALSVTSRTRIVQVLAERTLCVGALSNLLGISAGAVSQHLRVLNDAGLVEADRRGHFVHYCITPDAAARCQAALESLFSPKKGGKQCTAKRQSAKSRRT